MTRATAEAAEAVVMTRATAGDAALRAASASRRAKRKAETRVHRESEPRLSALQCRLRP